MNLLKKIINNLKLEQEMNNFPKINEPIDKSLIQPGFLKPKKTKIAESELQEVVKNSSDDDIRKVAIKSIKDQSFLNDVALNDSNQNITLEAVEHKMRTYQSHTPTHAR